MQQQYGTQGLQVVSLGSQWNQPYSCASWASTFGLTFPILDDDPYTVGSLFSVNGVPYTVIIDHRMTLRYSTLGFNQNEVVSVIEGLITELGTRPSPQIIPELIILEPAYPNPFNAVLTIPLTLRQPVNLSVTVFDVKGKAVQTLSQGRLSAGEHELKWAPVGKASGLYFIVIQSPEGTRVAKVFQLK